LVGVYLKTWSLTSQDTEGKVLLSWRGFSSAARATFFPGRKAL